MVEALLRDPSCEFWSEVRKSYRKKISLFCSYCGKGDTSIANTHDADLLLDELDHLITSDNVHEVVIPAEVVHESVNRIDGGSLFSDHVIKAPAMLHLFLAKFITAILYHGYIPSALWDAILLPIPKGHKAQSDSSSGVALASCVSKVLEWCIILTWSQLNTL